MPTYYDELKNLVESGRLEITWILSPPRSFSTAFECALGQSESIHGQVDEPIHTVDLHYEHYSQNNEEQFMKGCESILSEYKKHQSEIQNEPVRIITKSMSGFIHSSDLEKIEVLAKNWLILVRNPVEQTISLLTRMLNDKISSEPWQDKLSKKIIIKIIAALDSDKANSVLDHLVEKHADKFSENFAKEENKAQLVKQITEEVLIQNSFNWINIDHYKNNLSNYVLVDMDRLRKKPQTELPQIVNQLQGITYTRAMIDDWKKFTNEAFNSPILNDTGVKCRNAWLGPALNSNAFFKFEPEEATINTNQFPAWIQEQLNQYDSCFNNLQSQMLNR